MNDNADTNRNVTPIQKSEGLTAAEGHLKRLCDSSFLSLWSYPNIYCDKDHKEVCDLLVVFQEHIIIFSDKDCLFPNTGDLALDWNRWFKKAIDKSARQLWGAERRIKDYPGRLFLEAHCTQPFPIELPDLEKAKFHRILIAHGASERCSEVLGGSGSLVISPQRIGDMHYSSSGEEWRPFMVGQIDPTKGYIHIFDDTSLDIVMRTLDTITDFVTYLTRKELFIQNGNLISAAGEENLLAFYLQNIDEDDNYSFTIPKKYGNHRALVLLEDLWEGLADNNEYKMQIELNKVSYKWDQLIEHLNLSILSGTQYYKNYSTIAQAEKSMRFLAREPRLRRRMLAQVFTDFLKKAPSSVPLTRVLTPLLPEDPYYVFVLFPRSENGTEEEYRKARLSFLNNFCLVTKLVYPAALDIIGIATGTEPTPRSEDFGYADGRNWTEEMRTQAEKIQKELNFYTNTTSFPASDLIRLTENPLKTSTLLMKGRDRNKLCPCGSGKKRKKCCG